MRAPHAVVAVVLAAVSWGCAVSSLWRPACAPSGMEAVQPGMTAQQVEDAIGSPCAVDEHGGRTRTEVWRYDDGVVILDRGRVTYRYLTTAPKT